MQARLVAVLVLLVLGFVVLGSRPAAAQEPWEEAQASEVRAPTACPPSVEFGCLVSGTGAVAWRADNFSTANGAFALYGRMRSATPGANAAAVRGENLGTNANGYGVLGSHEGSGVGVYGYSNNGIGFRGYSNTSFGMYGSTNSTGNAPGVLGIHTAASGTGAGVEGRTSSTSANATGVLGLVSSTDPASGSAGVRGQNNGTGASGVGVWGSHGGSGWGVYGTSPDGIGVRGLHTSTSGTAAGVEGETNSTSEDATGVRGVVSSTSAILNSSAGVHGINNGGGNGVRGSSSDGYGGNFSSESYRALRTDTLNDSFCTAAFFGGIGIYVEGNCTGCTMAFIARNDGSTPLAAGDLVAARGVEVDPDLGTPVLLVQRATAADAVIIGVAAGGLARDPVGEADGQKTGGFNATGGVADAGAYLTVVVQGLAQVRVSDRSPVAIGSRLTASTEGAVASPDAISSVARVMSEPDANGLVWAMISGQ